MRTMIETVFEKGVFRPLSPVTIPENQRVSISVDESTISPKFTEAFEPLPVAVYPEDSPAESDSDPSYQPVPPKQIRSIQAKFVFSGQLAPPIYPEEE